MRDFYSKSAASGFYSGNVCDAGKACGVFLQIKNALLHIDCLGLCGEALFLDRSLSRSLPEF